MFMFYSLPFDTETSAVCTYQAILQSDWRNTRRISARTRRVAKIR